MKGAAISIRSHWIGAESGSFQRVKLAFKALGYAVPQADASGQGAYALHIAAQYQDQMSEHEALAVILWGLRASQSHINHGSWSLSEVVAGYGEKDNADSIATWRNRARYGVPEPEGV
jgi:hypothetical protein